MSQPFLSHLVEACHRPLDRQTFLEGYAEALAGVAQPHRWRLHGLDLDAPEGVYAPHDTSSTRFVLDHFGCLGLAAPKGRLLEVGCGAGAIALQAARLGWEVCAGDIDARAVQATRENAQANGVQVDVRESDLCGAFAGEVFEAIVFNQPFFHVGRAIGDHERTLATADGTLHARFLRDAAAHLAPGGFVVFTFSNCSDPTALHQPGWRLALRAFDFEASANYVRALFVGTRDGLDTP